MNVLISGFTVDFETDAAALDSIMNCEGIDKLPKTPSKLSSQFGPSKNTRAISKQNRAAPFVRSSLACRSVKGNVEKEQQNRFSLNVCSTLYFPLFRLLYFVACFVSLILLNLWKS